MSFSRLTRNLTARLQGGGSGAILARGAAGALVTRVGGIGIAFLMQVVLARLLGVGSYGIFIYAFTWMDVLALVTLIGGEQTLVRYLAAYRAEAAFDRMRGLLRAGYLAVLGVSATTAALGAAVVAGLGDGIPPELATTFYLGFAALPFLAVSGVNRGALRGLKRPTYALLPEYVLRPLLLLAFAGAGFWALAWDPTAPRAMALFLVAALAATVLGWAWLYREVPAEAARSRPVFTPREWLAMAVPALVMSGMNMVLKQTDVIMVGVLVDTDRAGIYAAASRAAQLVVFGLMSVNTMLGPMISELYTQGRHAELQRVVTLAARGSFAFMAVVGLALGLGGEAILGLFGPAFGAGYPPLLVLIGGQMVNALSGSVGLILFMTGNQKDAATVLVGTVAINLVLNALFIPAWGLMGAAAATATATALWNLILLLRVRRKLGIDPTLLGRPPGG